MLVHYGERLFYAGGYCPSCVAVAALQCTQPAYPIVLLAAEGTDRGELNHLQAATGVQVGPLGSERAHLSATHPPCVARRLPTPAARLTLARLIAIPIPAKVRYVQPIAAPKHCASQLIGSRQPLLGVLTKLNYWALTEFERVLNVDSDALAVRSLDGLVEMDMGKGDFAASGVGCQKDPVGKHAREGGTGTVRKWALHFKHQAGVVLATPKAEYIKRLLEMRSSTRERCKYSIEQPLVNSFFASKLGVKEVGDKISRRRDNPRFSQSFNCRLDNFGGCCDREGLPLHVVHTAGGDVKPWRDNGATRRAYKSKTRGAFMAAWCRMQLAWGVRNATGAPLAQSLTSGCFGELEYGGSGSARTHFEVEADEAVTTLGGDADRREEVGADDE